MLDKLSSQTKLLLLSIMLFVSLAMALFLPAMTTLYIFYPILVLSYLAYLTIKQFSGKTIFLNTLLIILGTIFTLGIPWLLSFMLFIHIFPTYLVALTTLIIMTLLPLKKYSSIMKICIFIFISIIVALNTNLLLLSKNVINQDRKINKVFNDMLKINEKEFIEINTNAKNIPIEYNKFDFLSFGSNEGCMCGYWELPRINRSSLIPYILGNQEIAFSWTKSYDKKIIIDYHETQKLYNLNIKILQKDELLSSLTINDYFPFQSMPNIDRKSLNNFDYRLEYLLRHNIWNAILHYSSLGLVNNKKVISDFLKKSINITKVDKNWNKSVVEVNATLLHNSNPSLCTANKNDDYQSYSFNNWNSRKKNYSIKLSPKPDRFIFNDNNITYTTISHSNNFTWHDYISTYKTTNCFFVLKQTYRPIGVILWKFNHQGNFLKEVHIKLPKNAKIDGRNWHPLSHIEVINNKMSFRINNIYEHKNKKNECSYSKVEIEI